MEDYEEVLDSLIDALMPFGKTNAEIQLIFAKEVLPKIVELKVSIKGYVAHFPEIKKGGNNG